MILKLNGKEMDQQPWVNVKYIEQLRELARPVVKTAVGCRQCFFS